MSENLLRQIAEQRMRTQYVRITVIDWNGESNFKQQIEGRATGGSINVNGKSNIRRTGTITLVADNTVWNITSASNIIAPNKKVKVEVGLKNYYITDATIAPDENTGCIYPVYENNIFWFPLGQYVITNASISETQQGVSISVSLKDYMCLLNGEIAGKLSSGIIHSPLEDENGNEEHIPLQILIRTIVRELGQIPDAQIHIDTDNIPLLTKNTVRWMGKDSVYLKPIKDDQDKILYYVLTTSSAPEADEYQYLDNIGYQFTNFIYPVGDTHELTSSAGETVTSVLDKIKNALGNFEYFFDINGEFHFQEIRNLLRDGSKYFDLGEAINDQYLSSATNNSIFTIDRLFMTSYSEIPQYAKIKNDITVWGQDAHSKNGIRYRVFIGNIPTWDADEYKVDIYEDENGITRYRANPNGTTTIDKNNADDWRYIQYVRYICKEKEKGINVKIPYGEDLKAEFPKIYNLNTKQWKYKQPEAGNATPQGMGNIAELPYYIDIIDTTNLPQNIQDIAVEKIGWRQEVKSDTKINTLFAVKFQDLAFIKAGDPNAGELRQESIKAGIPFTQYSQAYDNMIQIGSVFNSAYDYLRSLLHTVIGYSQTVNLSVIPLYHLDVNQRVTIPDINGNIENRDFMINTISIPLTADGIMNISASKVAQMI